MKQILRWERFGILIPLITLVGCKTPELLKTTLQPAPALIKEDGISLAEAALIAKEAVIQKAQESEWINLQELELDQIQLYADYDKEWCLIVPQKNSIMSLEFQPPILVLVAKFTGDVIYVGYDE